MLPSEFLEKHDWCHGALAKDVKGIPVDIHDPRACQFCAEGVIQKVFSGDSVNYLKYRNVIRYILKDLRITHYNDCVAENKREVIDLFKKVEKEYVAK